MKALARAAAVIGTQWWLRGAVRTLEETRQRDRSRDCRPGQCTGPAARAARQPDPGDDRTAHGRGVDGPWCLVGMARAATSSPIDRRMVCNWSGQRHAVGRVGFGLLLRQHRVARRTRGTDGRVALSRTHDVQGHTHARLQGDQPRVRGDGRREQRRHLAGVHVLLGQGPQRPDRAADRRARRHDAAEAGREDFDQERNVILEEIKRYEDMPSFKLFENLLKDYFGEYPLVAPCPGHDRSSISGLQLDAMQAYHRRRYAPNNIVFCHRRQVRLGYRGAPGRVA